MKKVFTILAIFLFVSMSVLGQKYKTPYNLGRSKTVSWTNDSIAPFKIAGSFIQFEQSVDVSGKTKDMIYDAAWDYLTKRYGSYPDSFKEKDREAGRISASAVIHKELNKKEYDISRAVSVYVKDEKMRVIVSLNHLVFGIVDISTAPWNKEERFVIDKDIAKCYPLSEPERKKPNFWENYTIKILRVEIAEAQLVMSEILESVAGKNSDW